MSEMKKALMFGDYTRAKWHPLKGVDKSIAEILKSTFVVDFTDNYDDFNKEKLEQYDLCISYLEYTDVKINKEQINALLTYVSCGGGLMVIHNGISLQSSSELLQMIGAKFTRHDGYDELPLLNYSVVKPNHEVMVGVQNFSIRDEPYEFKFDDFANTTLLLEFEYNGKLYPAAWEREFALGRVIYIEPGHCKEGFEHKEFRRLIANSAKWAQKRV